MKIKYLKLKNWLLAALGGVLGLSMTGCGVECEYGCPEATYHVKGVVTDEQGHPVSGIGVNKNLAWNSESNSNYISGYQDTTDKNGNYSIDHSGFPHQPIAINFNDIDGEQNRLYRDTVVYASTEDVPLSGGHGDWNEGEGNVTLDVTLIEKTNE